MSLPARVSDAQPAPRPGSWTRRWPALFDSPLLLLAYGVLAVVLFAGAWTDPFSRVIGVGPDPPVFIWYLRWIPFAITHGANPLFTNYLDYPEGINLMWQTSVPLLGLVFWPVTATLGPTFAYNLLMTASVALSAWCGFLAFRRHVGRAWAAAVGGLVFGFSPYMLAQSLGHPHVGVTFLCPLLLMAFEDAVLRQRQTAWTVGVKTGGLAAAQLLIGEELLLTEVLMAMAAIALLAAMRPELVRARVAYVLKTSAVTAAVVTVVAATPLWMQFAGPQAVHGTLPTRNVFVADLAGFVLPTSLQSVAPANLTALSDRLEGSQYEAGAYLGIPLLLALIVGTVRWWRDPVVQVSAMLALLAAALSLGLTLHVGGVATGVPAGLLAIAFLLLIRTRAGRLMPVIFALMWIGLAVVPLVDNVVASRLVLYVFLFGSLFLAVFADSFISLPRVGGFISLPRVGGFVSLPRLRGRVGWGPVLVRIAIAALIMVTLLPRFPFPTSPISVPPFFASGAPAIHEGDVALVVPYAHDFESRAMLWQLRSGMRFRMPEGYANRPGPSLDPATTSLGAALIDLQDGRPAPPVSANFRAGALAELQRWHVRAVVVGPMDAQDRVLAFLTDLIGAPPTQDGGVYLWALPS
jgi:hypothetical protein